MPGRTWLAFMGTAWVAMGSRARWKVSSLMIGEWAMRVEWIHWSSSFHRILLMCPSATSWTSSRTSSVRYRLHTCRPVYRGLSKMVRTALICHASPERCRLRARSWADGQGMPAAVRRSAITPMACPARNSAKIYSITAAAGSSPGDGVQPLAVGGLGWVRVRPSVGELVTVGRAATEAVALDPGLGGHEVRTRTRIRMRSPLNAPAEHAHDQAMASLAGSMGPPTSGTHSGTP